MAKQITWIINDITQVGGIERVVCNLSNYFNDNKYKVKIISLNTKSGKAYFKLSPQVIIQHFGYPADEILNRIKLKKAIRELLKKENGNSDIIFTCHPWIAMPILQQRKLFKGKIICTDHSDWTHYSLKRRLLNVAYYRHADRLVVLTDYAAHKYQRFGLENIEIIPNIIISYPPKLSQLESKELIAAGRLSYQKGFDRLIKAVDIIKDRMADWHITIYGDGEDKEMLDSLIEQYQVNRQISIAGFSDHLQQKLQNCAGFIMSSHTEGLPMVALEALSNGVPIVGFDIPPLREIDHNSNNIIFAEQDNVNDLADKILDYIKSKDKKSRGKQSREISLRYSLENIGPIWLNLIEML